MNDRLALTWGQVWDRIATEKEKGHNTTSIKLDQLQKHVGFYVRNGIVQFMLTGAVRPALHTEEIMFQILLEAWVLSEERNEQQAGN